jgi:ABC-type antimicrobial peptide transport system permease subunit
MTPPKWAQRFIQWYCRPEVAEDLLGDLNEYFERNTVTKGYFRARLIYVIDAFKFFRTYTVRKPNFVQLLINWIMIGSYIKTSGRNLARNKLFSAINIIGLAISMSVGLLMISFMSDLLLYDRYNENGDRIYRVSTTLIQKDSESNDFASSSIKTGRLIREKVTGIEETTTIRLSFRGDAKVDDNVVPIEAYYADPSIFRVFTFPMLEGDPATALKDPYSIVLTEESAKKIFGNEEALGKSILFDTTQYQVTGVMKDIPFFSHVRFESLVSFATAERQNADSRHFDSWSSMWSNHVYVLLPENGDVPSIQSQLDEIAKTENAVDENIQRQLSLQPLYSIALGKDMSNNIGPSIPAIVAWIISGLAFIVILSACFNYTNLSIARSLRRFKEIGLRKVIGAGKAQVRQQFLSEAVIVSFLALIIAFVLFLVLREPFLNLAPELQNIIKLQLNPKLIVTFVAFSIVIGVVAGFLPALFFARVNVIQALKDTTSVKVFRHLSLRKSLVVVQYTLTLAFITATMIGYTQYKSILAFDLGFTTENVLNIQLQKNKPELLVKELIEMPEVITTSKSAMVTSVGNYWGGYIKYKVTNDSTLIWENLVDENYFPLHGHKFVAGQNFVARPATEDAATEVIVNENTIKKFSIANGDPVKAIGEEVEIDRKKLTIVGVLKDYHFGKMDNLIEPVIFKYITDKPGYLNVKIQSNDLPATLAKIEKAWKEIDRVHPLKATFYTDAIESSYSEFSAMLKTIGFLAFLAVSIASLGLFGMVVFTTETRLKEISIRKVMGATSGNLILLLSRGFIWMLSISAIIALPATYFLFEGVVLTNFPYHTPVGVPELFVGLLCVLVIAVAMIGSQTLKAARSNPASVLKSE